MKKTFLVYTDSDLEEDDTLSPNELREWSDTIANAPMKRALEDDYMSMINLEDEEDPDSPVTPVQKTMRKDLNRTLEAISLSELFGGDDDSLSTPVRPGRKEFSLELSPFTPMNASPLPKPGFQPASGFAAFSPIRPTRRLEMLTDTPEGPRRIIAKKAGRGVVDNTNTTARKLESAELTTYTLKKGKATRVMGGDEPSVTVTNERIVCTFRQLPPSTRSEQYRDVFKIERDRFDAWQDPEIRDEVPLGAFTIRPAHFKGVYRGDLLEKQEVGMMYSMEGSDVTVIQPNNPKMLGKRDHFMVTLKLPGSREPLAVVALHKRVWAHRWGRKSTEVYYPRVPIRDGVDVGLRITASVLVPYNTPRDKNRNPRYAVVSVSKVEFEFPLTIDQFISQDPASKASLKF